MGVGAVAVWTEAEAMTMGGEVAEGQEPGLYPVMLRLWGQRCLVVGAGDVAARKVEALLACKAEVVVVAPEVGEALQALAEAGQVRVHRRLFRPSDLAGCRLAIAATDRPEVNRAVAEEARKRGVWVNVVDEPALCDFAAPAVVRRGPVVVAVSTGGASPALAAALRRQLEEAVGPAYGVLAERLRALRPWVQQRLPKPEDRRAFWQAALAPEVLRWAQEGRVDEILAHLDVLVRSWQEGRP